MTRFSLASVAFAALTIGSAMAADMPPSRQLPPPRAMPTLVPFFSWNGVYAGLNAGYGWGRSNWDSAATPTGNFNVTGPLVGGTLGFNYQTGPFVLGVEGDIAWSAMKGSTTTNCAAGCETRNSWLGTFRGRAGYGFDRSLLYLTGGMSFGDIKATTPGFPGATKSRVGYAAGAGFEYAFTSPWSAKIEYLYVDLGKFDCGTNCGGAAPDHVKFNAHLLRLGVNYKF